MFIKIMKVFKRLKESDIVVVIVAAIDRENLIEHFYSNT